MILDVTLISWVPVFLTPLWMLLTKPFGGRYEAGRWKPWEKMRKYLTDVRIKESRLGFVYLVSGTKRAE